MEGCRGHHAPVNCHPGLHEHPTALLSCGSVGERLEAAALSSLLAGLVPKPIREKPARCEVGAQSSHSPLSVL